MDLLSSASDELGFLLQAGAAVCGAAVALFQVSLVVWVARDVSARTRDRTMRLLAIALVALLSVFGTLIYLLLRPSETIAERYERQLIEELLAREISAASIRRARPPAGGADAAPDGG